MEESSMCVNRRWSLRLLPSFVLLILSLPLTIMAQTDRGAISGTVTDASGAIVQGARAELVSQATGLQRETVTNSVGIYDLPTLPLGVYNLTISKEGFKTLELVNIELSVGQARTMDVRLDVGPVSGTVQVTSNAEPLNRSSAEVGGLVDKDQIKGIPISGRNWASLMLLV